MLVEELLDEVKKLSWIKIIEQRSGFMSGYILGENKKKKTDFILFYEETYLRISLGDNKKGLRFVNYVTKKMDIPYLKATCCSFVDVFSFFKKKLIIYMWEVNDEKFAILYNDYERIVEENKNDWFGYKNIQILTP